LLSNVTFPGLGFGAKWCIISTTVYKQWTQLIFSDMTPTPYQSGDNSREQGISKAGNWYVRAMAIEIAQGSLRFQPGSALSQWYRGRFGHGLFWCERPAAVCGSPIREPKYRWDRFSKAFSPSSEHIIGCLVTDQHG
jgi:hypothetical protein